MCNLRRRNYYILNVAKKRQMQCLNYVIKTGPTVVCGAFMLKQLWLSGLLLLFVSKLSS